MAGSPLERFLVCEFREKEPLISTAAYEYTYCYNGKCGGRGGEQGPIASHLAFLALILEEFCVQVILTRGTKLTY